MTRLAHTRPALRWSLWMTTIVDDASSFGLPGGAAP